MGCASGSRAYMAMPAPDQVRRGRKSGLPNPLKDRGCGSFQAIHSPRGAAPMNDVTRILSEIEHGDPHAAEQLLPLVYDELRKLAAQQLADEKPGQTLQATALVHEAYLRLVGPDGQCQPWNSRGHFFAAAAEAMRRILVEQARRKQRTKHGGERRRVGLEEALVIADPPAGDLLA